MSRHLITRDDIMPMPTYAAERAERKRRMSEIKRGRRVAVGPDATFYFESYDTMWHQIHEMLLIERGGEAQIEGELEAYNPLVPKGAELVATLMFEIEDAARRAELLGRLGGVEETVSLALGDDTVRAEAEADLDRTNAAGKASAVQFVRFAFSADRIARFREPKARIVLAIDHPAYAHMAVLPETVRRALAEDFD